MPRESGPMAIRRLPKNPFKDLERAAETPRALGWANRLGLRAESNKLPELTQIKPVSIDLPLDARMVLHTEDHTFLFWGPEIDKAGRPGQPRVFVAPGKGPVDPQSPNTTKLSVAQMRELEEGLRNYARSNAPSDVVRDAGQFAND